jgi:hypothetical protein
MATSTPAPASDLGAKALALTSRGLRWLAQFDEADRALARRLLGALVLVSHREFEGALISHLRRVAHDIDGPVALYAARELTRGSLDDYFVQAKATTGSGLTAVASGTDIGSEGRIANLIRGLNRTEPGKFLNHPDIAALRSSKCHAIVVADDLVASGTRIREFIDALWKNRTLRSWASYKLIRFFVVCYSATEIGGKVVGRLRCKPELIFDRPCPTLDLLPWTKGTREEVKALCKKYAMRTRAKGSALGYGSVAALAVFEHGCPNNVPSIMWGSAKVDGDWEPLFPQRIVDPSERSAFPTEITRGDPVSTLIEVGQAALASSRKQGPATPLTDEALMLLALVGRRIRNPGALSFATGMSEHGCTVLIERCIAGGLITPTMRLTDAGRAELIGFAGRAKVLLGKVPNRGEDDYYPASLRSHRSG